MRRLISGLAAALSLAACDSAEAPEQADQAVDDGGGEPNGSGLALAEAQREGFVAYVAQNTQDCLLPDDVERASQAIDLAPGVGAVIVQCSQGMRDIWSQLFIAESVEEGGHPMAVPLYQYDIQGDGEWRAEFASPNLSWDADRREFVSSVAQAATACGTTTRWRWDPTGRRVALVEQTTMDCEGLGPDDPRPEPRVVWPTNPPTPEPGTA